MTQLPAVVTIQDLPTGTTVTGTELLEVVQTSGGVAQSVQLSLNQIFGTTLGALPSGGGTGQILKSQGSGLLASWANVSSMVTASTGLAESGSTTIALSLASTAGLSVLGVAGVSSAVPAAIAGTGAQVFRINDGATAAGFGALNLGSSAAVTGVLPGANYSAVNLAASGAGGVQGILSTTNMTAVNVGATGGGGIQGQPFFLPTTNLTSGGATTMGILISSAAKFGIFCGTGVPTLAAGTGSLYLRADGVSSTTRVYTNLNGATSWTSMLSMG